MQNIQIEAQKARDLIKIKIPSRHGIHRDDYFKDYYLNNRERLKEKSREYRESKKKEREKNGVKRTSFLSIFQGKRERKMVLNASPPSQACVLSLLVRSLLYNRTKKRENHLTSLLTKSKVSYSEAWKKARDKQSIRVATGKYKPKWPFKKNWEKRKEKETAEQLISKYQEYGTRLGHKYKRYYDYILDIDFYKDNKPRALGDLWKKAFLKIMSLYGVKWDETSNGNAHVNLLLEEEAPNGILTYLSKYGVKWRVGEILGKGRQARATHKTERGEGKWAIKAKNINEVSKIFKLFFFDFELTGIKEPKHAKSKKKQPTNINVYETEKTNKNHGQNTIKDNIIVPTEINEYKKLEPGTQILVKDGIIGKRKQLKRPGKPLFKQYYQRPGKKWQYFLIDTHYQNYTERIINHLPEGTAQSFILNQGHTYQFFNHLLTENRPPSPAFL